MLEPTGIFLKSTEIKILNENNPPQSVGVNINIVKVSVDLENQQAVLDFEYRVDYEPKVAFLDIKGYATAIDTKENLEKLKEEWKKKNLPGDLVLNTLNMINTSVGLNTVLFLRPFNLLPPFSPPPVGQEQK